jgi:heme-degrading monooxygenase HmoA
MTTPNRACSRCKNPLLLLLVAVSIGTGVRKNDAATSLPFGTVVEAMAIVGRSTIKHDITTSSVSALSEPARPSTTQITHPSYLPSCRFVKFSLMSTNEEQEQHPVVGSHGDIATTVTTAAATTDPMIMPLRLERQDGLDLYGKQVIYQPNEATFASLSFFCNSNDHKNENDQQQQQQQQKNYWDATLVLTPTTPAEDIPSSLSSSSSSSLFIAMNRFHVKNNCKGLFEERWEQRTTQLPTQSGFVGFSLLRKREHKSHVVADNDLDLELDINNINDTNFNDVFNYASCTIWSSLDAWQDWRNGDGRYTHVVPDEQQDKPKRTPSSEWMYQKARPIFWNARHQINVVTKQQIAN